MSESDKVLGIVSAYFTKGQNLNFAVPVAMLYTLNKSKSPKFDDKLKKLYDLFMQDMVLCPAGSFMMGSPENELGRFDNETQHKVTILKPFYIGKYEVTQSLYENLMGNNQSKFKGENNPIENVSWYEAKEFCKRLNTLFKDFTPKGYKFDLPTEAQWEYACRAGTTTSLNSGKNITSVFGGQNLNEVGWYGANSKNRTHPVGQKKPNAWGIYDMHGNVNEWCRDPCREYTSSAVTDQYYNKDSFYFIRGGCCRTIAALCRSANRNYRDPSIRNFDIGFRLALVPVDE